MAVARSADPNGRVLVLVHFVVRPLAEVTCFRVPFSALVAGAVGAVQRAVLGRADVGVVLAVAAAVVAPSVLRVLLPHLNVVAVDLDLQVDRPAT